MGPTPKETLELLLCNSTFVGSHLERIIKPLTTCTHDREPNHRPSYETVSQRHPALLLLLQKHEGFWRGKEGTRILSFYFADRRLRGASCMCLILRPFMSTNLADYSPHNSVIRFDFRQAISMRDKAKAKQLIDYGMSPAAAFESLFDDWSPAVVNDQDMGDLAFYLTAFKPLKRETSMLLSNAVFCRCRQALELLLDAKIGHELPHVNTGMLTSILSPNMDREDDVFMFEQLIAKALQQPKMIRDWKRVEDGIKRCEGEPRTRLLRLWQTYKDNFPTNSSGQYDELDDERVSPFEDVYYY